MTQIVQIQTKSNQTIHYMDLSGCEEQTQIGDNIGTDYHFYHLYHMILQKSEVSFRLCCKNAKKNPLHIEAERDQLQINYQCKSFDHISY